MKTEEKSEINVDKARKPECELLDNVAGIAMMDAAALNHRGQHTFYDRENK